MSLEQAFTGNHRFEPQAWPLAGLRTLGSPAVYGAGLALPADVDCLIDIVEHSDRSVIRLVGRLRGEQVPDLLQAYAAIARKPVIFDLEELLNADFMAVDALLRFQQDGVPFVGMSEYMRLKLASLSK